MKLVSATLLYQVCVFSCFVPTTHIHFLFFSLVKGNNSSNFDSNSASSTSKQTTATKFDQENAIVCDDDDFSLYTPQKPTSTKQILLPSARKNAHQSQIDRAYSSQIEANRLLGEIVIQNNKLIEQNKEILSVLKKMSQLSENA